MSDEGFQLQIEHHAETHLLQTLRLGPQRSVQILELYDKYYLLERYKGERRPPLQLEEPALILRLARGDRLLPDEVEPLLPPTRGIDIVLDDSSPGALGMPGAQGMTVGQARPGSQPAPGSQAPLAYASAPADPLESKLQNAMARFAAQNPQTAEALQWPGLNRASEGRASQSENRARQPEGRTGQTENRTAQTEIPGPLRETRPAPSAGPSGPSELSGLSGLSASAGSSAALAAQGAYGSHPALGGGGSGLPAVPEPVLAPAGRSRDQPIETWTQPLVLLALQQASDNQQKLLEQAAQLKRDVDQRSERVQRDLDRMPAFQERLDELNGRLEQWQSEMERHHFSRDSLLERTDEDLSRLQRQLRQILSDGLALQKVLREHRFPESVPMDDKLACFEDMLDHVVQQRHWVHYLLQQQAFRELERERVRLLTQRCKDLNDQIVRLKDAIQHIEQINREILSQDPLAVPEPVPALALHELIRLEYELQVLDADPALKLLEDTP